METNEYFGWTNEQLYYELVNMGIIDEDVEPYKYWRFHRDEMINFLLDVEQIWQA